jgi:hypothetical protein
MRPADWHFGEDSWQEQLPNKGAAATASISSLPLLLQQM